STGLYVVDSPNTTIGGGTGAGNVISASGVIGVHLTGTGTTGARVQGNRIGTNAAGTAALPNLGIAGGLVEFGAAANGIATDGAGQADTAEGNQISGNGGHGVLIRCAGADNNVVAGNFIGTNAAGTAALANAARGVWVGGGATGTRIGTDGNGVADAAE